MMNFEYRLAQRNAVCRCCDKDINKNEPMITGYSYMNTVMYMHFHPELGTVYEKEKKML